MSRHVASCRVMSRYVRHVPHVASCHVLSRHVMSYHVMSRHVTSRHGHVMPRHVTSCHVMPRHVMSRHVTSRHVTSCYAISRRKSRDDHTTNASLSTDFFHTQSIQRIRSKFSPSDSPDPFLFPIISPPNLSNFNPTTFSEIRNLIFSSQNKQCEHDSIPTFLLKLCFDELGPTIINIINFSLSEGIFPSSFKQAIVHPLLKKPSLPDDDLSNFRPISNLNFISKILEKVVASRIQSHLLSNSLSSSFQSAYRMFHSTETTLLSIHNDLILAMDRGEVTSLILLDLSAAFDTVDHSILLHRLQHWFGVQGTSLDWFSSYLSSRSQAVSIQNSTSSFSNLSCGVPQGSVPWPTSFHSVYNSSWVCHL